MDKRREGLSLPQAGAIIGSCARTVRDMTKAAPQLVMRAPGQQARIMPSSLPALRAMRDDGLARRAAGARRALMLRWGKA